ncbi:MAG: LamG-like jellyroll fold domain-containing protein [Bacteroidota bacterium]|jgi:hypothetical protein
MKKKNLLLSVAATLCFAVATMAQTVPSYVPTNGLVGWWPFNGNANDESGNGNNGTVNGATLTSDRFGNANKAYSFDGVDDRIETFNDILTPNISISLWVKLASSSTNYGGCMVSNTNWSNAAGEEFGFAIDVNSPNFSFPIKADPQCIPGQGFLANQDFNTTAISSANSIGFWHFCVITTDGNLNNLYLDGNLIESRVRIGNIQQCTGGSLRFGAWWQGQPGWFKGTLDDIGIWNRALTQQEITNLYNGNICYQYVTVTDTLVINTTITNFNPITYQNSIKIFPNPSNDHITIDYGNFATLNGYQLKITNSLGQQMFQTNINQQSSYISLASWSGNGIYFVHLIDAQGNTVDIRKIVLQ